MVCSRLLEEQCIDAADAVVLLALWASRTQRQYCYLVAEVENEIEYFSLSLRFSFVCMRLLAATSPPNAPFLELGGRRYHKFWKAVLIDWCNEICWLCGLHIAVFGTGVLNWSR